jgi:hypothetical protein
MFRLDSQSENQRWQLPKSVVAWVAHLGSLAALPALSYNRSVLEESTLLNVYHQTFYFLANRANNGPVSRTANATL